jgi:phospholipase C
MKKLNLIVLVFLLLAACTPGNPILNTGGKATAVPEVHEVPTFDHIVLILLENKSYSSVIGASSMPHLNDLARKNVLLANYFAVAHPSLPNYIALVSGTTADISSDCTKCFVNVPNLADLLDASGHTWKTYQEDMPSPCYVGDAKPYYQKHDPFIYFDSIRLNSARCSRSVVPLSSLKADLVSNQLPSFALIMPNNCNSSHSCSAKTADDWLYSMVNQLQSSPALGKKSLIIVTFDEGSEKSKASCCGLPSGGGQVATILISPLAKQGFQDNTAYSHYSLLKTILTAWKLPDLGATGPSTTQAIIAPWLPGSK